MNYWLIVIFILCLSGIPVLDSIHTKLGVGVVDRLEGEKAVILLEDKREEIIMEKEKITKFSKEDSWVLLLRMNNRYFILKDLPTIESEQKETNSEWMKRLRNK